MDDAFDVDEILKGAEKDVLGGEELDEDAILGTEESFDKTTVSNEEVKNEEPVVVSENGMQPSSSATSSVLVDNDDTEQLDYEEEVVPQKPAVKEEDNDAESTEKPSTKPSFKTERVYDSRGAPPKNGGNKYYVNPKFNPQFGQAATSGLTNGFGPQFGITPSELMPPGVTPAGPIRLPPVKIAPGMPLHIPNMPPPGFRTGMPLPGSIRLPGPIPLTLPPMVVPQPRNFNVPPPGLRMPHGMLQPGSAGPGGDAATWQLMVDAFVRKATSDAPLGRNSRRRSPSSSDRSRSYSSSSRSSRSRSRSRSPRRHRRRSPKHRRSRSPHDQPQRRRPRSPPRREERRKEENASHHTIECAQAIGLDEEYMRKIEEQKRMREEVARRKEEARRGRRQDTNGNGTRYANDEHLRRRIGREERDRTDDRRRAAAPRDRDVPPHDYREPQRARYEMNNISSNVEQQQRSATREQQRASADAAKQAAKAKPYLTVVVTNCGLEFAGQLASTVGQTKKVWMINANAAAVIFEKHDDAKNFMLQYHAKSLNGVRIDVTLEKMFLNLAAIP